MVKVRTINGYRDGWAGDGTVYIGRRNPALNLPASPLGNPFKIGPDGDRNDVVAKYKTWLAERVAAGKAGCSNPQYEKLKQLVDAARSGTELRLACYCKPRACHGDAVRDWILRLAEDESTVPSKEEPGTS